MNFLKKKSIPDAQVASVAQDVAAHHAAPKSHSLSVGETTRITSLIAGILLGVATMVLYQKLEKKQASQPTEQVSSQQQAADDKRADDSAPLGTNTAIRDRITAQKVTSTTNPKQAKEGKPSSLKEQPFIPTPIQPGLIPLLPAPKTTPLRLQPFNDSELRHPSNIEKEDGEGGVHIEIRKSQRDSSKAIPRVELPEPDAKLPNPHQGAGVAVQISGAKKTNTDPVEKTNEKQTEEQSVPKFKILERQGDGVLIRIGNQVRFVSAGSTLPDGKKVD